jgi:hypothetical protein
MKEETKEEYLSRIRKEKAENDASDSLFDGDPTEKKVSLKARLKSMLFMLLFALFLWAIFQIFGMLKSN